MKENDSVLLCMELCGNVTINKKLLPAESIRPDDYLRERISHYTDRGYLIPDNNLVIMRFPNRAAIPSQDGFDGYSFIEKCKKSWPALHDYLGVRVPFEGKLQVAAYCINKGMEPSYGNMKREYFSRGFSEFRSGQRTRIGLFEDSLQKNIPPHKRPDDWSFVLGMSERTFSVDEQKDILALGCIISTGLERGLLTPRSFPSFNEMRYCLDNAERANVHEAVYAVEELEMQAKSILDEKYPHIAPMMKNLCGIIGNTTDEKYCLIDGSGKPILVRDNNSHVSGFLSFLKSACNQRLPDRGIDMQQCKFIRFRANESGYDAAKWGVSQSHGIKPMNEIGYLDASYCLDNGRSPLHPANMHRNLVLEREYAKFIQQAGKCIEERKLKPMTKKVDTPTPAARLIPQPKKRGPSL